MALGSRSQPLPQHAPARPAWRPVRLLWDAGARWSADGAPQLGAAIAFCAVFAMAPLLLVAIAIAGALLGPEAARGGIVDRLQDLVGIDAARGIQAMVGSAWRHPQASLASTLSLSALLIGAVGVFVQLRRALDAIGHVAPAASSLGSRLVGFALVLGAGFLAVASLLLSAVVAAHGAALRLAELFALLDVGASTLLLVAAFAGLLHWVPAAPPSRHAVWCGAVCSALLFSLGKHLAGLYLARVGIASSVGAAGALVVAMLWVYASTQALLYGAALAAALDGVQRSGVQAGARPIRVSPEHGAANAAPPSPSVAVPTSLAAARSRLRPATLAARRRGSSARGPAVLLRFPDVRRAPRD
jgi:membrane protein